MFYFQMARYLLLVLTTIVVFLVYFLYLKAPPPLPKLDVNEWWGPEDIKMKQDLSIRPFKIEFSNSMIEDLRMRLKRHRSSPPALEGVGFEYGFNSGQTDKWLKYWGEQYPFKEREQFLNQFPQFKTNIHGLDIHFIRVKPEVPKGTEIVQMLLLHGWPGSVREFYEAIPRLTSVSKDRDFAIEVIAPSLVGFGFSDAAVKPGMGTAQMAVVMRNLMKRLGFNKFYIQGGDWGSVVGGHLATLFPEEVLGYHTNLPFSTAPSSMVIPIIASVYPSLVFSQQEIERVYPLTDYYSMLIEEMGYLHLHATKPDTIGIGLTDSPSGLLIYILQMFSTWTCRKDVSLPDGGLELHFSKEQIIDNIMFYWAPNSISTAIRLYAESFSKKHLDTKLDEIPSYVPTWVLQSKHEPLYQSPLVTRIKFPNILNVTVLNDGGHFVALELPEAFSDDVIQAIGKFRNWKAQKTEL
ncbi:PREDICTED: juvenile hormone epoxide hydrolase-like isoform X1 [Papilio xuthus]|uniref:Epoxide hydrolase n=2 Tax=Papilio xuthus TaxID=66420 RepID=A0AAJ7E5Q8_PAPXU|nr:PREDICTED: juvenile hormone epoxide hydrolase-like isoform X1 [Papilio xuthus]